jgi:membrane-associated phospholipid phosphatase
VTLRTLLTRTAIALLVSVILVAICYYWIDRPVAWFVHGHGSFLHGFLRWPPLISDWLKGVTPAAIGLVLLWWAWRPGGRLQTVLLAISANIVVTNLLKQLLKRSFGRCWPETWEQGNPSLIGSGAYGFRPFQHGVAYESFPSGHAAIVCSVLSILWFSYPRWRWLYAIVGGTVCVALVEMNYHFVGDVIAGVTLGSITGVYLTYLFRLHRPKPAEGAALPETAQNGL